MTIGAFTGLADAAVVVDSLVDAGAEEDVADDDDDDDDDLSLPPPPPHCATMPINTTMPTIHGHFFRFVATGPPCGGTGI
jgi:hypothetical protein